VGELAQSAQLSERTVKDLEGGLKAPQRSTVGVLTQALALDGQDASAFEAARRSRDKNAPPDAGPVHARDRAIPRPLTSFIGRDRELRQLEQLLRGIWSAKVTPRRSPPSCAAENGGDASWCWSISRGWDPYGFRPEARNIGGRRRYRPGELLKRTTDRILTTHPGGLANGMNPTVIAVSRSSAHTFSKPTQDRIQLRCGLGVEGDAHLGRTVQHLSRKAREPDQPNLRQVHLVQAELHDELCEMGFEVSAGQMGENITTRGLDLLRLPSGTRLHLGEQAVVEITGLRNPCSQLDRFQPGLMAAVLDHDEAGNLVRKAGVMAVVLVTGDVHVGAPIRVELPPLPHQPLEPV
jgi:hypothetical protein